MLQRIIISFSKRFVVLGIIIIIDIPCEPNSCVYNVAFENRAPRRRIAKKLNKTMVLLL